MYQNDLNLWMAWHNGEMIQPLTKQQKDKINACNLTANMLLPLDELEAFLAPYGSAFELRNSEIIRDEISHIFGVPMEIVIVQLDNLCMITEEHYKKIVIDLNEYKKKVKRKK